MKNKLIFSALLAGCCMLAPLAQAAQITGTIRMSGDVTLDTQSLATANAATAFASVSVVGGPTGSYVGTSGAPVTWTPFSWVPSSAPVSPLWTFNFGGFTYTFNLLTIDAVTRTGTTQLLVTGSGIVNITGAGSPWVPTAANWSFTITDTSGGASGSFVFGFADSNTAAGVPDGGTTVMLLGAAVSALGLLRKKLAA